MMTTDTTMRTPRPIDLGQLSGHMPWSEIFRDMGYPMPYPEVVMAGELAYAQYTQMNSLLMTLAWELDNRAHYHLERAETSYEAYMMEVDLELGTIHEAWEVIGISPERLHDYLLQAVASWARHQALSQREVKMVRLMPKRWMLTLSEAE